MRLLLNPLAQLVRDLDRAGLKVALSGQRIAVSPIGRLTPELRQRIAPLRADLIDLLSIHGEALMSLFRASGSPLSEAERASLATNAAALKRKAALSRNGEAA
jgi:hypothetical protein